MKISEPKVNKEEDADLRRVKEASMKQQLHKATLYIPVELYKRAQIKALNQDEYLSDVVTRLLSKHYV
jgi:hypothetical protein